MKEYNLRPPVVEASVRPYAYEINLDTTAKGFIQPSVKVRMDNLIDDTLNSPIERLTVLLLDRLVKELRQSGYKIATDIEEVSKNGKD